jgi:hypothetical protein
LYITPVYMFDNEYVWQRVRFHHCWAKRDAASGLLGWRRRWGATTFNCKEVGVRGETSWPIRTSNTISVGGSWTAE